MINKIVDYLDLREVGALELFYALIFILSGYSLNGIPLSAVLWVIFAFLLLSKKKENCISSYKPLIYLSVYCILHEFIYLFIANGIFNAFILQIVYFWCLYKAPSIIDEKKIKGSINWIAIISMGGLLYQWTIIASGGEVRPIGLPFLEMSEDRLDFSNRPSSFFMEPAAFVAFMYVPLAFSLIEKKYIWSFIIILANFLTTSTTGILTSFIMLGVYVFSQKISLKIRILVIMLGAILFLSLANVEAFQAGVSKMEETDAESNIRLAQGPYIVSTMHQHEYFFGAAYHDAYHYCLAGRAPMVVFYTEESVFMSTFWLILFHYGVTGMVLYLMFYFRFIKKDRETLPLIACLIATMFSSGYGVGPNFVYTSICLFMIVQSKTNDSKELSY